MKQRSYLNDLTDHLIRHHNVKHYEVCAMINYRLDKRIPRNYDRYITHKSLIPGYDNKG